MPENLLKEPITDPVKILRLIPQKPPFVMVDRLLEYSELTGVTGFSVSPGNLLIEEDHLSEAGLIEHMAQSMSLHRGYQTSLAGADKAPTGFIGMIKSVEIIDLPPAGSRLTTFVEILHEVMKVTTVTARTENEKGEVLARSEMKTVTVD